MPRKIFVVGHKNPDTDSIVSALAYAELLRLQGEENVVPARQGDIWRETRYILDCFGLPLPVLVEDVRPHARDVMTTDLVTGSPEESAYCVGRRLREHRIRAMPLVEADSHLVGLITVEDFAHILLMGLDRNLMDQIHLDVHNVVEALGGRLLVQAKDRHLRDKVMVAAMDVETVRRRVDEIRDELLDEMKALRAEKGYAALLFMVVDIVHSQTEIFIAGMEKTVAEALGQRLTSPNSVMIGGVMSRKKQVVPILPRVARQWKGSGH